MKKIAITLFTSIGFIIGANAQTLNFDGKEFEISAVKASVIQLNGEEVIKVERDLKVSRLTATKYLDSLASSGFVQKQRIGRSNYYVNLALNQILLDQHEGTR